MNNESDKIVYSIRKRIDTYRQLIASGESAPQRALFQKQLDKEVERLDMYLKRQNRQPMPGESVKVNQRVFSQEELAQYNGSGGKPAYVAVKGIVYDVSNEAAWGGGTHFGIYSGRDLTEVFANCHNGRTGVLNSLPQVGTLG